MSILNRVSVSESFEQYMAKQIPDIENQNIFAENIRGTKSYDQECGMYFIPDYEWIAEMSSFSEESNNVDAYDVIRLSGSDAEEEQDDVNDQVVVPAVDEVIVPPPAASSNKNKKKKKKSAKSKVSKSKQKSHNNKKKAKTDSFAVDLEMEILNAAIREAEKMKTTNNKSPSPTPVVDMKQRRKEIEESNRIKREKELVEAQQRAFIKKHSHKSLKAEDPSSGNSSSFFESDKFLSQYNNDKIDGSIAVVYPSTKDDLEFNASVFDCGHAIDDHIRMIQYDFKHGSDAFTAETMAAAKDGGICGHELTCALRKELVNAIDNQYKKCCELIRAKYKAALNATTDPKMMCLLVNNKGKVDNLMKKQKIMRDQTISELEIANKVEAGIMSEAEGKIKISVMRRLYSNQFDVQEVWSRNKTKKFFEFCINNESISKTLASLLEFQKTCDVIQTEMLWFSMCRVAYEMFCPTFDVEESLRIQNLENTEENKEFKESYLSVCQEFYVDFLRENFSYTVSTKIFEIVDAITDGDVEKYDSVNDLFCVVIVQNEPENILPGVRFVAPYRVLEYYGLVPPASKIVNPFGKKMLGTCLFWSVAMKFSMFGVFFEEKASENSTAFSSVAVGNVNNHYWIIYDRRQADMSSLYDEIRTDKSFGDYSSGSVSKPKLEDKKELVIEFRKKIDGGDIIHGVCSETDADDIDIKKKIDSGVFVVDAVATYSFKGDEKPYLGIDGREYLTPNQINKIIEFCSQKYITVVMSANVEFHKYRKMYNQ